jgi:hypothetical protein
MLSAALRPGNVASQSLSMSCRKDVSLSIGDQTGGAKVWLIGVDRTGTVVSIVVFIGLFLHSEFAALHCLPTENFCRHPPN